MQIPQVRFGDWVRHEKGYSRLDKILNIDILPQGDSNHPDTKHQDAFYVELTLDWLDLWLPDKDAWTTGAKHAHHMQMSEYLKLEAFRGNRAECEAVVMQIIGEPPSDYTLQLLVNARHRRIATLVDDNRGSGDAEFYQTHLQLIDVDMQALCRKHGITWEAFIEARDADYREGISECISQLSN